jgi:ankyrin repeat protein
MAYLINASKTPLHHAVGALSINECENLLRNGRDVNEIDNNGFTPLHLSILSWNYEKAKLLLAYGADRTIKNREGRDSYGMVYQMIKNNNMLSRRFYDLIMKSKATLKSLQQPAHEQQEPTQPQQPSSQPSSSQPAPSQERSSFLKKMWQSLSKEQADYHLKIMTTDEFNELRAALQQQ